MMKDSVPISIFMLICLLAGVSGQTTPGHKALNAFGWGYNGVGQLGRGYETVSGGPNFLQYQWPLAEGDIDIGHVKSIVVGKSHAVLMNGEGRLFAWGSNEGNKLGIQGHPTDETDEIFQSVGPMLNKRSPVLMRNSSGPLPPMQLLGATDKFTIAFDGEYVWYIDDSYSGWRNTHKSSLVLYEPNGLSCSGDYCVFYEYGYTSCVFLYPNPDTIGPCDTFASSPWTGNVTAAATYGKIGESWGVFVSNGSHLYFRSTESSPNVILLNSCDPTADWCQVSISVDPFEIKDIVTCDEAGTFFVLTSSGDVVGFVPASGEVRYSTTWPHLKASSISCSKMTLHFVNRSTEEGDTIFSALLPGDPHAPLLARQWEMLGPTGVVNTTNSIDMRNVIPQGKILQNVKLAKRSAGAMAAFATFEATLSQLRTPDSVRYNAVSWGDNSLGQAMWHGDTFFSMKPKALTLDASWLPDLSLSESNCSIHSSLEITMVHCRDTGLFIGGITYGPINAVLSPPNRQESVLSFWTSTSKGYATYYNQMLQYLTREATVLNLALPFSVRHMRGGGGDQLGILDEDGFLLLYDPPFPTIGMSPVVVDGVLTFHNTSIRAYSDDSYTLSQDLTAIYSADSAQLTTYPATGEIQTWNITSPIKKLAAMTERVAWLDETGIVREMRDVGRSTTYLSHNLPNCIDIASFKRMFFAIAESTVSLGSMRVYAWGYTSYLGETGEFNVDPNFHYSLPSEVSIFKADSNPTKLCDNCMGNTMMVFLEPKEVSTDELTSINRNDPFFGPTESPIVEPSSIPILTCWGRNDFGQCASSSSVSTTQGAFSRNLPLRPSQLATPSFGTFISSGSRSYTVAPTQGLPRPFNSDSSWYPNSTAGPILGHAGTSITAFPQYLPLMDPTIITKGTRTRNFVYRVYKDSDKVVRQTSATGVTTTDPAIRPIRDLILSNYDDFQSILLLDVGFYFESGSLANFDPSSSIIVSAVLGKNFTAGLTTSGVMHAQFNGPSGIISFSNCKMIAGGKYHLVVLSNSGLVFTYGYSNELGQLGITSAGWTPGNPNQIPISDIRTIGAGDYTTFALKSNGAIYVWGLHGPYEMFGFSFSKYYSEEPVLSPFSLLPSIVDQRAFLIADSTVYLTIKETPPPVDCPGSPPTGFGSNSVVCLNGVWVVIGNVGSPGPQVTLTSPVIVEGNLTIPSTTTIQISLGSLDEFNPILNINGCATIDGTIEVTLTPEDLEKIEKEGGSKGLSIVGAKCGNVNANINVVAPKSCKKVSSTQTTTNDSVGGGYTLGATFRVSSNGCRLWWIVLVSVLGGLIVLVVVAILVVTLTPLKYVVRPHAKRAKESNTYYIQGKAK